MKTLRVNAQEPRKVRLGDLKPGDLFVYQSDSDVLYMRGENLGYEWVRIFRLTDGTLYTHGPLTKVYPCKQTQPLEFVVLQMKRESK